MAKRGWLVVLLIVVVALQILGQEAPPEEACPLEVTAWLAENAIPFDTTDPTAPLDDLEPLRAIIGDARIVGLGEQTHGTKEFFEMKHRIFRFLVEEMGFRTLAFEAPLCGLLELNECLLSGGPPIESQFHQLLYDTWFTDEVFAMLQWMRTYNEEHPSDPVRLIGLEFMSTVIECVGALDSTHFAGSPPSVFGEVGSVSFGSSQAFSTVQSRTRKLRGIPSNAERAGGSWAAVDQYSGQNVRDQFMAANVSWWLNTLGEETKIAIWAHNGHIARGLNEGLTWIMMGKHLSDVFGDNYLPIGFSFAEGNFNSFPRGAVEVTAEPLIPGCYEAAFQTTHLARFFIDLRELESCSAAHDWMIVERPFQVIGGGPYSAPHYLGWDYPTVLPKSFDIIIHIETTTATQVR